MQQKVLNAPGAKEDEEERQRAQQQERQRAQQQQKRMHAPGVREAPAELDEIVPARPPGAQQQHRRRTRRTSPAREPVPDPKQSLGDALNGGKNMACLPGRRSYSRKRKPERQQRSSRKKRR